MDTRTDITGDLLDDLLDGGNSYDRLARVLKAARAAATDDELAGLHAALAVFASTPRRESGVAVPIADDAVKRRWFSFRLGKMLTAATLTGQFLGGAAVAAAACGVVAVSEGHHQAPAPSHLFSPTTSQSTIARPPSPTASSESTVSMPERRPTVPPGQTGLRSGRRQAAPPGHTKTKHDNKPAAPPGHAKTKHAAPPGHTKTKHDKKPAAPPGHTKTKHDNKPAAVDQMGRR